MASSPRLTRQKISTTISPETLAYLDGLIRNGEARSLAEALDLSVERLLVFENRERLACDTAAYFSGMTDEEATEEQRLEAALAQSSAGIDFDQ
jgi:PHD/YefM family antitoxin component YafN of YafNO toxin-antitoxin module